MGVTRECGRWRTVCACVLVMLSCAPAKAFYWFDWPGSGVRPQPTLIAPPTTPQPPTRVTPPRTTPTPPPQPTPPTINPPPPLIREPLQPVGPTVPFDRPVVGPPVQTPEPSTAVIGLLGLGTLALVRRLRKVPASH